LGGDPIEKAGLFEGDIAGVSGLEMSIKEKTVAKTKSNLKVVNEARAIS